jgi:hypothetical protein
VRVGHRQASKKENPIRISGWGFVLWAREITLAIVSIGYLPCSARAQPAVAILALLRKPTSLRVKCLFSREIPSSQKVY